jgi:hypothetical protein
MSKVNKRHQKFADEAPVKHEESSTQQISKTRESLPREETKEESAEPKVTNGFVIASTSDVNPQ